ncbi:hypothetical protein GCM10009127_21480 [Alteraurantiacibacter aestuarii]
MAGASCGLLVVAQPASASDAITMAARIRMTLFVRIGCVLAVSGMEKAAMHKLAGPTPVDPPSVLAKKGEHCVSLPP